MKFEKNNLLKVQCVALNNYLRQHIAPLVLMESIILPFDFRLVRSY